MRTTTILLVVLALSCSCDDLTSLTRSCQIGAACWDQGGEVVYDIPSWMDAGECSAGTVVQDGDDCLCVGRTYPVEEVCDGLDNDCDGESDNIRVPSQDPRNSCTSTAQCPDTVMVCSAGTWFCERDPTATQEVCDGLDNDCDGDIDDGLDQTVYDYPEDQYPLTVGIGECRPGMSRCDNGRPMRVEPIVPRDEIGSNGHDDDCDGLVDECWDTQPLAVALVVDVSGSMNADGYLDAVTIAACNVSARASRIAIVAVATGWVEPYVVVITDFVPSADACALLQDESLFDSSTGAEYMLEGVDVALNLSWPDNHDGIVTVFTDEKITPAVVTVDDLITECTSRQTSVVVYTKDVYSPQWRPLTDACDGSVESLSADPDDLELSLVDVLVRTC